MWTDFSKEVAQAHLAASTVMPVVRLTHCEHSSKFPSDAFLQDRSRCQSGELFWKHKPVCTTLVWIAGRATPLKKKKMLGHQDYKCRCYLNPPTCSCTWVWPLSFPKTMVRIIQSKVASYGWRAHGSRLYLHSDLGVRNDRQANPYMCPFAGHAVPSSTC